MESGSADVVWYDDADACFEASSIDIFRWVCRIAGPTLAREQLPAVYRQATTALPVNNVQLLAIALRLARDAVDGVEALAICRRAVLDLVVVDRSSTHRIGLVTGLALADIDDAVRDAKAWFATGNGANESVDDVLRHSEVWLDDEVRDACRRAMRATAPPSAATARASRRVGITVGVVAASVLAAAWFTVGRPAATPAASGLAGAATTITPTSAAPATTSLAASAASLHQPPGYLLDPLVPGFAPTGITEDRQHAAGDAPSTPVRFQIWAEPAASRETGRWFSIMTTRCFQTAPSIAANSTRLQVDGRQALLSTTSDGLTQLDIVGGSYPDNNRNLQIVAHGLTGEEVTAIAGAIQLDEPGGSPNCIPAPPIQYSAAFDSLHDGLDSVVDTATSTTAIGYAGAAGWRTATYTNTYNGSILELTTQPFDPAVAAATRFELAKSDDPDAPTTPDRTVQIDGRTITVSSDPHAPGSQSSAILQWSDGTNLVSLTSNLTHDLPTLLRTVSKSRPATPQEWLTLAATPVPLPNTGVDDPTQQPSTRVLATTVAGAGTTWELTQFGHYQLLLTSGDNHIFEPIDIIDPDPDHPISEFNTFSTTVLVVALSSTTPGDAVRVTFSTDDTTVETSTFGHVVENNTDYTVLAFDHTGPYTVELLHDGAPIRTLTS